MLGDTSGEKEHAELQFMYDYVSRGPSPRGANNGHNLSPLFSWTVLLAWITFLVWLGYTACH